MAKRKSNKKQQQKNRNQLIGVVALMTIIIIGAIAFSGPKTRVNTLSAEISVQEAYSMREQGTLILDVRTPAEWIEGHVPGATLIPLDELDNRLSELPMDEEIVVICRSGNRSATARDILLDAGFSSVTSVAGGFNDWVASGYPFETGQ